MDNKIKFEVELTPGQYDKFNEWKTAHKLIYGQYGVFSYQFTETGVDTELKITSNLSKHSIYFIV